MYSRDHDTEVVRKRIEKMQSTVASSIVEALAARSNVLSICAVLFDDRCQRDATARRELRLMTRDVAAVDERRGLSTVR
jgi:hypothetical protein